jgi:hypothetical protein
MFGEEKEGLSEPLFWYEGGEFANKRFLASYTELVDEVSKLV